MKVNRLEAHDRLLHFQKTQRLDISECCQDLINKRPFGEHPFYIFAHARTIGLDEKIQMFNQDMFATIRKYQTLEDVPEKVIIWQPRLTKPKAQPNSMLFKACPGSDNIKIIWMLPAEEMWGQYQKGNLTENQIVSESIHDFKNNRKKLEEKEEDDLSDSQIDAVYKSISLASQKDAKLKI